MITIYYNAIECHYGQASPKNLDTIRSALSWLCLLERAPVGSQISISRRIWDGDTFCLLPLAPVDWSRSCWRKMLNHGIVASFDNSMPDRPLLKTVPHVMFLIPAVINPLQVDDGLILAGFYSAMVPITMQSDGYIRWHFEMKEAQGPGLRVVDMQSFRHRWYQTLDLQLLVTSPAYIGWSAEGSLLLGTDQHSHSTTWASRTAGSQSWQLSQMNLKISIQIPHGVTVAGSATFFPCEGRSCVRRHQ